jgi:uncharacterized membrane protein YidH (DUF202 family)
VDADESARMRDLLASNRTMLAWIRTSVAFAGLGFVVAKFGRTIHATSGASRGSVYLGIFLVLVGLALTAIGYAQHRSVTLKEKPPPGAPVPLRWPSVTAAAACALSCALLAAYLAATAP